MEVKTKNKKPTTAYERARKRVDNIKAFYRHLAVYLIVNSVLLLAKDDLSFYLVSNSAFDNSNFLSWINWNVYGTPILWGIGLLFHAISVFGKNPFLGKAWEEKQIRKIMEKEK